MEEERILVTGAAGFAGSHLIEFLLKNKSPKTIIWGTDRWLTRKNNINHLVDKINYTETDITDAQAMFNLLDESQPNIIFHLAAQSFVPNSWSAPEETIRTNIIGQINLFEAVRRLSLDPKIQIACSSEEYGMVFPNETPIRETNPMRPLSTYGVSKVAQDLLGYQYHASYGLKIIRTRAFNHTGPRRDERFATSSFAKQIAEIIIKKRSPLIRVGNLSTERDFSDVRDIVRGYWLAATEGEPGDVYNLCSGTHRTLLNVLNTLIFISGEKGIDVITDASLFRPSDVPLLYGDYTKFRSRTGWTPIIPFEETMDNLLHYWVNVLR